MMYAPFGWLFKGGVSVRHWLYDKGVLRKERINIPVISVGNIVAGGSGKTQVALKLAQELDRRVAIVSRGYKSRAEKKKRPLVVDCQVHTPEVCGDEPWLLASRLPETLIVVSRERALGAVEAMRRGAEIIVLDDGMQHRALHRDKEVVVIDASNPFGGGYFLPQGRLREDPRRLKGADLLVLVGHPDGDLQRKLERLTPAPQVEVKIVAKEVLDLQNHPVSLEKGENVGVFCGIGNPKRFVRTVEELGANVVATCFVADHAPIGIQRLAKFATQAKEKGAKKLLCTEKDRVKLSPKVCDMPIGWVKADLEIVRNREAWDEMLQELI